MTRVVSNPAKSASWLPMSRLSAAVSVPVVHSDVTTTAARATCGVVHTRPAAIAAVVNKLAVRPRIEQG